MGRVHFGTPLSLQRQAWVLSELKRFKSESILELGCSSAPLLQAVLPAPLYVCPSQDWKDLVMQSTRVQDHEIFRPDIVAPRRMIIMDVDENALQEPIQVLQAEGKNRETPFSQRRWDDLHVKVICGSLVDRYENVVGDIDVAVATEVIEHLGERELAGFAPSILGRYRPKVLLLTTPNYGFNTRFGSEKMLLDPTERTERLFRHSDHKFEWTAVEFRDWCKGAAQSYGYTVNAGGIGQGTYSEELEKSNEDDRYATHTATFVRQDVHQIGKKDDSNEVSSQPLLLLDFLFAKSPMIEGSEKDVIDATIDAIIDHGELAESSSTHQRYQARLWAVWMCDKLRCTSQGRLDTWLHTLGIIFEKDSWSCLGSVKLQVNDSDLMLSCRLEGDDMIPLSHDKAYPWGER
ncbi:hypothetical protein CBS101457_003859 [Exobasidium rhododendri]|nr:hypothetical protein CBS101457_003859 [Exobasidium rhododendri]